MLGLTCLNSFQSRLLTFLLTVPTPRTRSWNVLFTFVTSVRGDLRAALCLNASTGRKLKDRPPAADDSAAADAGGGARNDKDSQHRQHRWVASPRPSAQDTIYQFEHREVVVQKIGEHSKQLVEALGNAVPIIITTWPKISVRFTSVVQARQAPRRNGQRCGCSGADFILTPDWLECLSLLTNGGGDGISQWVLPAKDISAERAGLRSERPAN